MYNFTKKMQQFGRNKPSLESHELPKLNHDKMDELNSLITIQGIECSIIILPKKYPDLDDFTTDLPKI